MKKFFLSVLSIIVFVSFVLCNSFASDSTSSSLKDFLKDTSGKPIEAVRSVYKCVSVGGTMTTCSLVERQGDTLGPGEYADYQTCIQNCKQCVPVYTCNFNGRIYSNSSDCVAGCKQYAECGLTNNIVATGSGTSSMWEISISGSGSGGNYFTIGGVGITLSGTSSIVGGCSYVVSPYMATSFHGNLYFNAALEIYVNNNRIYFVPYPNDYGYGFWSNNGYLQYLGNGQWSGNFQLYGRYITSCFPYSWSPQYRAPCYKYNGSNATSLSISASGNRICFNNGGCITTAQQYVCPIDNSLSCSGSPPSCSKSYSCSTGYVCSLNNAYFNTLADCQSRCY